MSQIRFLSDTIIVEAIAEDMIASIANNIKDYVSSEFANVKDAPITTVLSFIGPGLLWKLGFPWMGVLYEAATMLGFDWNSFWTEVRSGIGTFLSTLAGKPNEQTLTERVTAIITSAIESHFTGSTDKTAFNVSDALMLKKISIQSIGNHNQIIKTASIVSKMMKLFIKIIGWAAVVALVSLGYASAGGAISGLLGIKPSQPKDDGSQPVQDLQANIPPEFLQSHKNDFGTSWIEHGDIDDIRQILSSWISEVYPQLTGVENSAAINRTINAFKERNKFAAGTNLITVPAPYTRKIDIVSSIVNAFLKEKR